MPRKATGKVIPHTGKDGRVYQSLRFTAYGKRRFVSLGVVSEEAAEAALRHTLSDVERGTWTPPAAIEVPPEPEAVPTFHQWAEQWWTRAKLQLSEKTRKDYGEFRLERHLIPAFGEMPLDTITFDAVEGYIAMKLAEGERIREAAASGKPLAEKVTDKLGRTRLRALQPLSPRSINMTVTLLAQILEPAVERDLLPRNTARGRGRRVKEAKAPKVYLESAGQIRALLDAAGEQDRNATKERTHLERRAMLATMIYGGLRIGELCSLRWRDVRLDDGWLDIPDSKTPSGIRKVKIRGALRNVLEDVRSRRTVDQKAYVFPTRTGRRQYEDKVRVDTLGRAVKRANANLESKGQPPLPQGLEPHGLRHTFSSLLYAVGETPPVVMAEIGHKTARLSLELYAHVMRRGEGERAALAALLNGAEMADSGIRGETADSQAPVRLAA